MSDSIYRKAAIDALIAYRKPHASGDGGMVINILSDASIEQVLAELPSAEPEIILCKDCKWFGDIGCAMEIVDDSDRPHENDFCSFAERKTDE